MTTHEDQRSKMQHSLSAMFDDEATEDDLQCLLKEESLEEEMRAFHLIQQSLHKESSMDMDLSVSLVQRVRAQIDLEDSLNEANDNRADDKANDDRTNDNSVNKVIPLSRRIRSLWPSLAMAASVAFVVILGGDFLLSPDVAHTNQVAQQPNIETVQPATSLAELNKHPLDADSIRLQNYLRQHAEQATMSAGQGMIPMARLASYPKEE